MSSHAQQAPASTRQDYLSSPYHIRFEAIEGNCLYRAANSNKTAEQRIQCQQAMVGSQLRRIDESLGHNNKEPTSVPGGAQPQRGLVDDTLQGVGSQFDGAYSPIQGTPGQGHLGRD
ncbi:hypothetical protein J7T55_005230 [Diaporthe amygdali]|uniref:uncharacterized protein n=1 Tax=Phomopsis amygdali TaxID=1214568 RepID=UPI0022FE0750|nr:uncharacterized protein J7T55_005230 [Diaporthe amygdali]KAJ0116284.1 hypothetical protein J7T55_005230 [Diaporthe amygdali]